MLSGARKPPRNAAAERLGSGSVPKPPRVAPVAPGLLPPPPAQPAACSSLPFCMAPARPTESWVVGLVQDVGLSPCPLLPAWAPPRSLPTLLPWPCDAPCSRFPCPHPQRQLSGSHVNLKAPPPVYLEWQLPGGRLGEWAESHCRGGGWVGRAPSSQCLLWPPCGASGPLWQAWRRESTRRNRRRVRQLDLAGLPGAWLGGGSARLSGPAAGLLRKERKDETHCRATGEERGRGGHRPSSPGGLDAVHAKRAGRGKENILQEGASSRAPLSKHLEGRAVVRCVVSP